jgi:hypothetical protein
MIKTFLRSFAALALLLASGIAAASVYSVNETYASGAVFNGTLTFQADGQLVSGNGTLTGAGYNNDFGWIFNGSPTFGISQGANQGYTWLVDNTSQLGILVDWNYANPSQLAFITSHNGVYSGPVIDAQNIDHAVSSAYTRVPEPASLALMAAGLIGLARVRKAGAKS